MAAMKPTIAVLDYGSGNIHSAMRMLSRVGADVTLTHERDAVMNADGLFVPGVGNFHACMRGLRAVGGDELIAERVAANRPLLGVCVGMQILFATSAEPSDATTSGLGLFEPVVQRLAAPVVPHMGWSPVTVGAGSELFTGIAGERFYFVHSYAVPTSPQPDAVVTTAVHGGEFVAAIERGPVKATQFHPEKSGDAGAALLTNWLTTLT